MDDGVHIAPDVEEFLRAARAKNVESCEVMLNKNPDLLNSIEAGGYGALHFAAYNGDISMIKMLLGRGCTIDLENYDNNAPLVMAVKGRQLEAIRLLVAAGADVNKASPSGGTALHHAASMGYLDCVRLLVELGAKTLHDETDAGSLLHWASNCDNIECVGIMIYDYNIPVNCTDKHGGTPLFTALFSKKTEIVEFLLEHDANPNAVVSGDGATPLHVAVEHGNAKCVQLLCSFGANPHAKNKEDQTPIDIANRMANAAALKELWKPQVSAERRAAEAARYKCQGNKVFAQGENVKAAKFYTLAIHLDNTNHAYFSNRAACYFNQKYYKGAYWDSMRCIRLNPSWPRGYVRKSITELALGRYENALATAKIGLELEPNNKDLLNAKEEALKHLRRNC